MLKYFYISRRLLTRKKLSNPNYQIHFNHLIKHLEQQDVKIVNGMNQNKNSITFSAFLFVCWILYVMLSKPKQLK